MFLRMLTTFRHRFGPVLLSCAQAGTLMAVGDMAEQHRVNWVQMKEQSLIDRDRTRNMLIIGLMEGPILHYWYTWLDRRFVPRQIFRKILLDQGVISPILCVGFLYIMPLLSGESHQDARNEVKNKIVKLYALDCTFWPLLQYINFRFLPTHLRVTYVCSCTLIWDALLSCIRHES
ncbi:hypothetical protein ACOME3_002814 [Neoechinorhynchus agilis]